MLHLLALAVFGGSILLVDLRFFNLGFKTQTIQAVARELLPLTVGGVVAMAISGVLMYAGSPMRYFHNPAFQVKMALFVIALFVHFSLQILAARSKSLPPSRTRLFRTAAVASLLLWFAIGFSGRVIGYL
jgi:uncharacterized membrane protein